MENFWEKTTLKMDFKCQFFVIFKKGIKSNQSSMWKVNVGPCGGDS
jgi:hypothetical protein